MSNSNNIAGLDNKDLVMIYYRFLKYKKRLENDFKNKSISKEIETPFGKAIGIEKVSDEEIDKFKNSEYYKTSMSIVDKLSNIVAMIEETDDSEISSLIKELK